MSTKIYTKTGDLGNTSLIGGTRVPKNHIRIEAYGTVDELNSFLGLLGDHIDDTHGNRPPDNQIHVLSVIQDRLFVIGSTLARDPEKQTGMKLPELTEEDVALLENEIDAMNVLLPPLQSFILPGGHVAVSTAHVARCVCRRAERHCVNMAVEKMVIEPLVIKYLNRLSDYLFVLARFIGNQHGVSEKEWKGRIS